MKNRIYTFCNGNDIVNDLKETSTNELGKTKIAGCNTCHPGDHVTGVGSTGPAAEAADRLPPLPLLEVRLLEAQAQQDAPTARSSWGRTAASRRPSRWASRA